MFIRGIIPTGFFRACKTCHFAKGETFCQDVTDSSNMASGEIPEVNGGLVRWENCLQIEDFLAHH